MKIMKKVAAVVLSISMLAATAACGKGEEVAGDKKWSGKSLVVCSWGGAIQEAQKKTIFDAFAEKYGCTVEETTDPDPAKIKSMVEAGNMEVDVWDVDCDFVPRGIAQDLFEKLDFNVISKEGLVEGFITEYSVPAEISTLCISWNTEKISSDKHPKTWTEFFDSNTYPGKRTLYTNPMSMFEAVLLADGVKKEDMYPIDVDRVFKYLDAHKSDIVTFWTSGAQSVELVAGGDAALGTVWGGRVIAAQKDGQPIEKETNEAILTGDAWVIGKGSKNVEMAQDFIAFATSPEVIANYAVEYPGNAPANTKAYDLMTKEQISALASSPELEKTQLYIDVDWWVKNYDAVYERFQKWLIS
ncbi:putative spermidine/putrescine transport system substrate-binding protein [Ruminiclostridium sufflavum DSM 19573]|uniref:Putative spermidine/putrescine transport system substrate-binding protein n=1 Tax=Ruminiclostridium sufflavum DSM 19573 TaxID=1121337 RepID=A0A318Y8U6_9FIRM|nr:ABC transporter substrate-binding protein [Ruminiclostridium sufflavum]PYG88738.1 putative spermidine/putrescine transport system substrate-binding protein [Ruminiclostridium sufflavum DSM 19573]